MDKLEERLEQLLLQIPASREKLMDPLVNDEFIRIIREMIVTVPSEAVERIYKQGRFLDKRLIDYYCSWSGIPVAIPHAIPIAYTNWIREEMHAQYASMADALSTKNYDVIHYRLPSGVEDFLNRLNEFDGSETSGHYLSAGFYPFVIELHKSRGNEMAKKYLEIVSSLLYSVFTKRDLSVIRAVKRERASAIERVEIFNDIVPIFKRDLILSLQYGKKLPSKLLDMDNDTAQIYLNLVQDIAKLDFSSAMKFGECGENLIARPDGIQLIQRYVSDVSFLLTVYDAHQGGPMDGELDGLLDVGRIPNTEEHLRNPASRDRLRVHAEVEDMSSTLHSVYADNGEAKREAVDVLLNALRYDNNVIERNLIAASISGILDEHVDQSTFYYVAIGPGDGLKDYEVIKAGLDKFDSIDVCLLDINNEFNMISRRNIITKLIQDFKSVVVDGNSLEIRQNGNGLVMCRNGLDIGEITYNGHQKGQFTELDFEFSNEVAEFLDGISQFTVDGRTIDFILVESDITNQETLTANEGYSNFLARTNDNVVLRSFFGSTYWNRSPEKFGKALHDSSTENTLTLIGMYLFYDELVEDMNDGYFTDANKQQLERMLRNLGIKDFSQFEHEAVAIERRYKGTGIDGSEFVVPKLPEVVILSSFKGETPIQGFNRKYYPGTDFYFIKSIKCPERYVTRILEGSGLQVIGDSLKSGNNVAIYLTKIGK